jgi:pilus assembly protein TadC
MGIERIILSNMPDLKKKLKSAGIYKTPELFIREALASSIMLTMMITVLAFFMILKMASNLLLVPLILIFSFIIFFTMALKKLDVALSRRAREIDKDVLFAGRFLLVKLNSGKPLINAIVDASNSYGVASKFFKEMVQDIELGTPLEESLNNAYNTTPSKKFKKILFQINNALKIGVDVSMPLEATLEEISQEQLIEIQKYGKKLNSLIMFYMLAAIVLPSLGITLFSVIGSMVSININFQLFFMVLFVLFLIQIAFVAIFRSIRPNLNI